MKTILLTGASGFVGTNFILDLHKKFRIIALVRQNSDVKIIENKCEILRYGDDIYQTLDEICGEIDGVIHLATKWLSSHTPEDIKDIIDANILLGTYILEAVKRHNTAFFINATSFGAYCNSNRYRPATLYAASKRAFEDIIKYYALVAKGTTFCNLLIFNTFGLYDKTPRLFNLLDKVALNGEELDMSDGTQIVDYTHIKNVVFGFECLINLVLEKPSFCKNKLFTLQSHNRRSLRELVALYERLLGKKLNINWGRRAKRELEITQPFSGGVRLPNWREKVSLEAGLSELIARNVKNRKVGEVRAKSRSENHTAKNSANKNRTAKAPNAKNRKWGGAESRFLKESFALYIGDSTLIVFEWVTPEACVGFATHPHLQIHTPFTVFVSRSNPRPFTVFARRLVAEAIHKNRRIYKEILFLNIDCHANPYGLSRNDGIDVDCHDSAVAESRNDASTSSLRVSVTSEACVASATHPYLQIHLTQIFLENTESQGDFIESIYDSALSLRLDSAKKHTFTIALFRKMPAPPPRSPTHKKAPLFLLRFARKLSATLLRESLANSRFLHKKSGGTSASFTPLFVYHEAEREKVSHFVRIYFLFLDCHEALTSHNDGIGANHHAYKGDSSNERKAIPRKSADSSHYIAESRNEKTTSDSTAIFTRKLHKSHIRKAVA